jgi:hypothetical protein
MERGREEMSELDDDIARGCLPNGEPIEARWGTGWWSQTDEPQGQEPEITQCPKCNGAAYELGVDGIDCENCGHLTREQLKIYYGNVKP